MKNIIYVLCISLSSIAFAEQYKWVQWTGTSFNGLSVQEVEINNDGFDKLKVSRDELSAADFKKQFKWPKNLQKVVFIGDTGCRLKEGEKGSKYQDCQDPQKWPFAKVLAAMVKEKPDLIVHLGDYHYREQCSKGKICEANKAIGYGWQPWKLDFFDPAKEALQSAPWVIVRGNHEDCQRAFAGYKLLLRNENWTKECIDYEQPSYSIWGDLLLINLDSSTITDKPELKEEDRKLWLQRFADLEAGIEKIQKKHKIKHIWLLSHKPIFGLVAVAKKYGPENMHLGSFFKNSKLASKVELMFAGHVHNSHLVLAQDQPLQIVIGNSGTMLDEFHEDPSAENLKDLQYEKAKIITHDFGYAVLSRKSAKEDWHVDYKNPDGQSQFFCDLGQMGKACFQ